MARMCPQMGVPFMSITLDILDFLGYESYKMKSV